MHKIFGTCVCLVRKSNHHVLFKHMCMYAAMVIRVKPLKKDIHVFTERMYIYRCVRRSCVGTPQRVYADPHVCGQRHRKRELHSDTP